MGIPTPLKKRVKPLPPEPEPETAEHTALMVLAKPLIDLAPCECKWAVNNAAPGERHLFCAATTAIGEPYCGRHKVRSFDRTTPRRRAA